nr:CDP-alcohol phosphatidyltransferase family protein [Actinomadura madurae]
MANFTLDDVRQRTYKARDAWWTVLLVDPLASRLVRFTANRTRVTPNQLTVAALILGLGAGACFAVASWPWLLAGAVLYHLSFTLDCMDGKIARLKGTGSVFGAWLDYIFDRVRVLACAIALMAASTRPPATSPTSGRPSASSSSTCSATWTPWRSTRCAPRCGRR